MRHTDLASCASGPLHRRVTHWRPSAADGPTEVHNNSRHTLEMYASENTKRLKYVSGSSGRVAGKHENTFTLECRMAASWESTLAKPLSATRLRSVSA